MRTTALKQLMLPALAMGLAQCKVAPSTQMTNGFQVRVTHVTDGDTFQIDAPWSPFPGLIWKVRVRGMDAPEMHSHCAAEKEMAYRAKVVLEGLMRRSGESVYLRSVKHDKYGGRFDATVVLSDGRNLDDVMTRTGIARVYNGGERTAWCDSNGGFIAPQREQ